MFTIRGKLLIYALEIVAAAILLLSMPAWEGWVQVGLTSIAVFAVLLATFLGRSIAANLERLVNATRRIGEGQYDDPVPVRTSDEIGALGLEIDRMRILLREKVRLLEELNRDLERAVEARTDELRKANERLSLIHRVTNAVSSSLDFHEIFEAAVEGTKSLVDFDQATITRISGADTATVFAISGGPEAIREGKKIPLAASRVADVIASRRPAVFDVSLAQVGEDTLNMSAIRREIVLPLVVGDQVIGTFNLGSRRRDAFSQTEIEVLAQISAELGVALVQAEAFEREHEAAQKLKDLSDLKSEFVSKVSHELRTPLTSVMGAVDNLLDGIAGPIDERPRAYLRRMKDNSDRLLHLINDLLDLSRIEAGKEEVVAAPFRIEPLVRETIDTLRPLAEQRHVVLESAAVAPLILRADRDKIARVLLNLAHNALKFTPAGGRVEISADDLGEAARLSVRDTGAGIPAAELERIFDKFHQVRRIRGPSAGSGLGLAISRQLVEMHGGQLTVRSTLGAGTTFEVVLPRQLPTGTMPRTGETWHAS